MGNYTILQMYRNSAVTFLQLETQAYQELQLYHRSDNCSFSTIVTAYNYTTCIATITIGNMTDALLSMYKSVSTNDAVVCTPIIQWYQHQFFFESLIVTVR